MGRASVSLNQISTFFNKKWPLYCPQGSGTLRQQLLMMHGIAWYCILHHIAPSCTILHHLAPSCTMLHQSLPEYARVFQSMPEYARVCQSMPEYARVCQSMSEYARVCQRMTQCDRVCQSVTEYASLAKICQISAQVIPMHPQVVPR